MADTVFTGVAADAAETLEACAALSAQCFANAPAQQWAANQLAVHLEQNSNALFVAHRSNAVAAFALFTMVAGEGELLSICVDIALRHQGLGQALLAHALACLQPQRLLLEVAADNLAAISLYQRLGFVQIDRRKAYYTTQHNGKTDAIVMALSHPK